MTDKEAQKLFKDNKSLSDLFDKFDISNGENINLSSLILLNNNINKENVDKEIFIKFIYL